MVLKGLFLIPIKILHGDVFFLGFSTFSLRDLVKTQLNEKRRGEDSFY